MLSSAYFLAKFRFDTAENEPAKNLQTFAKFANFRLLRLDGRLAPDSRLRRLLGTGLSAHSEEGSHAELTAASAGDL